MIENLDLVVLCGGRGARLRPATDSLPKALIPVKNKPILHHVIDLYRGKGLRHFTFCIGYLGQKIKESVRDHWPDIPLQFSDAGETASMLSRLWKIRELVGPRLLVVYCDTYVDLEVAQLIDQHARSGAMATIVTAKFTSPFGITAIDHTAASKAGMVSSFEEKPTYNYFIGNFIIEREVLETLDPTLLDLPDGQGLVALFQNLISERRLAAFPHDGINITFNTESERDHAEASLRMFFTLSELPDGDLSAG